VLLLVHAYGEGESVGGGSVGVGESVGVGVGVGPGFGVGVGAGVGLAVGEAVGVGVGAGEAVGDALGLGLGLCVAKNVQAAFPHHGGSVARVTSSVGVGVCPGGTVSVGEGPRRSNDPLGNTPPTAPGSVVSSPVCGPEEGSS
jgi:hypothetical protein